MGGRQIEKERSRESQPCAVTDNHQKTAKGEARAEPNVPLRLGDGSRSIAASFQADAPDFDIQNTYLKKKKDGCRRGWSLWLEPPQKAR